MLSILLGLRLASLFTAGGLLSTLRRARYDERSLGLGSFGSLFLLCLFLQLGVGELLFARGRGLLVFGLALVLLLLLLVLLVLLVGLFRYLDRRKSRSCGPASFSSHEA